MQKVERVAAYIRVSTDEQRKYGLSLDAQRLSLREYAKRNDLKIVEWYEDEGVSGARIISRRPALQRMISDAQRDKFDRIIFIRLDRFFRSVAEYHECMKLISPIPWTATEEGEYDLTTANGRAFVNMKLTIHEFEVGHDSEKILATNAFKVKTGQPLSGRVHFCWKIIKEDNRKRIIINPETRHIMEDLLQHVFTHKSKRGALIYINKKYNMGMHLTTMDSLLKKTWLYGAFRDNPDYLRPEDRYLTKEQFDTMQEFLKKPVKRTPSGEEYLFPGLLRCPLCGRVMKCHTSKYKKKDGSHTVYHKYICVDHTNRGVCTFSKNPNEKNIEALLLKNVESILNRQKVDSFSIKEAENIETDTRLEELQQELSRLNYAWQKGRIKNPEDYDAEYDRLVAKIEGLKVKKEASPKRDFSRVESALSGDWASIYASLDNVRKRAFWGSFIKEIVIAEDWRQGNESLKEVVFL